VERHLPLAGAIARRYCGMGLDLDDLAQEAARGLCDAALRYDLVTHQSAFATYARPWMKKRIALALAAVDLVRDGQRLARDMDDCGVMPPTEDETIEHVEQALDACSDKGRAVVCLVRGLYGPEMSLRQAAHRMGISERDARHCHDEACIKIAGVFRDNRWPA
jgi:RNA polymerase sigma factor (sigma-70 family)